MKKVLVVTLLGLGLTGFSQVYIGKKSKITFFSEAKMENIDATNTVAQPVFSAANGVFVAQVQHSAFVFKSPLMQEHYNENYMESEKFPFATFKGKVKETVDYTKDGVYNVNVEGTLDIHGVSLPRTISGTITVKSGTIILDSKFDVKVSEHNIKVPTLYVEKIAEIIKVTFHTEMEPKK
ncbi:MAG: YceI family protein [Bacteroidetes bacterium]|nr:YceI family protein [Bacteroidota bacterium]